MLELAVVLAVIAILASVGGFALQNWATDQRAKGVSRDLADLLQIARAEAIRSSTNHVVFFGQDSGGNPLFTDAGQPAWALAIADPNGNAAPDGGEARHDVPVPAPGTGVIYGRALGRVAVPRNAGAMMGDPFAGTPQEGTLPELNSPGNFRDPTNAAGIQSMVLFAPDGTPRSVVPDGFGGSVTGMIGSGDGAVYVTNGNREFAVVMAPLGAVRVFSWDAAAGQWR
jgi:type II secretory pathway pseudopilin PulG